MWVSKGGENWVSLPLFLFFKCTIWQDCQHHLLLKCWWWECECYLSWLRWVKGAGRVTSSTAYLPAMLCSPMPTCLRYATRIGSSSLMMRKRRRRRAKAQQSQMENMVPGRAASQQGHPMQASLLVSGESPSILYLLNSYYLGIFMCLNKCMYVKVHSHKLNAEVFKCVGLRLKWIRKIRVCCMLVGGFSH